MNRDAQDIYSRPGHLIRRLQQIAVAIFMEQTAEFDITPVQYSALLAVRNHPGTDQTTLTSIIAFDRSTIGEVVKRLENKGLVRRGISDADRRAKVLYITPSGRRLLSNVRRAVDAAQDKIVAPLSREERSEFMRMMHKLVLLNNEQSRVPLQLSDRAGRHGDCRPKSRMLDAGS
jgi:MarR family transcriptional regulator, lower aerobic nicotinate degradation pathway regulator